MKENTTMNATGIRGNRLIRGLLLSLLLISFVGLTGCSQEEEGANDPNYAKGEFKRPGSTAKQPKGE
jgi:hypothetical protein